VNDLPATTPVRDPKASEVIDDLMMVRPVSDDEDHPAIDAAVGQIQVLHNLASAAGALIEGASGNGPRMTVSKAHLDRLIDAVREARAK